MKQILRFTKCVLAISVIMLISTTEMKGQHFSPYFGDNYAGISGVYNNPASIANSRYILDITLVGVNTTVRQNYFGAHRKFMFNQLNFNKDKRQEWQGLWEDKPWILPAGNERDQTYLARPDESDKMYAALIQNEIQIFNFMISCGPKFAFGITERVRTIGNMDNMSWGMMESMFYEGPKSELGRINNDQVRFALANWNELGLSLATQIWDGGNHYIKLGASFKIWQGLSSAYFAADNFSYEFLPGDDVYVEGDMMWGASEGINSGIKDYQDNRHNGVYDNNGGKAVFDLLGAVTNQFYHNPFAGKHWKNLGFGLDVGLVYEWRPDHEDFRYDMDGKTDLYRKDMNKYKLKVSVAVLDINLNGGIKYVRDYNLVSDQVTTTGGIFPVNLFNNVVKSTEDMNNVAQTIGNDPNSELHATGNDTIYAMKLSPTLTLGIDFNIGANFYVNLGAYVPFSTFKGHAINELQNDSYNVINVHSEATFNLTPRYERKWFGAAIPITYQLVNKTAVDVGLGLRLGPVWIGSTNIISNSLSKYWRGVDICAAVKIPIMYCKPKDNDNDGVSNKKDKCPYQQGPWETRGCPDTDGDGIVDSEDDCPNEAGLPEYNGCPDTDGDGIIDKLDECPDVPGLPEFNGCPDTDGDGIPDHLDACPEEAGTPEFNGCPETKFMSNDSDGDGIPDDIDDCPNLPGTIEYNGCPEDALVFELEVVDNFDINKAVLKPAAKEMLDQVVEISKANKARLIYIVGHADITGNDKINDPLSLNRAKSVKNYLVDKGIDAKKISIDYEGSRDPIAPNNTKEGRAKNRRVNIEIFFIEKQ